MTQLLLVILFLAFPLSAHAYLNPEVGSALYQGIIASVLVVGATWKLFGRWIRDVFKKFR